jgi:hypothetical protein
MIKIVFKQNTPEIKVEKVKFRIPAKQLVTPETTPTKLPITKTPETSPKRKRADTKSSTGASPPKKPAFLKKIGIKTRFQPLRKINQKAQGRPTIPIAEETEVATALEKTPGYTPEEEGTEPFPEWDYSLTFYDTPTGYEDPRL